MTLKEKAIIAKNKVITVLKYCFPNQCYGCRKLCLDLVCTTCEKEFTLLLQTDPMHIRGINKIWYFADYHQCIKSALHELKFNKNMAMGKRLNRSIKERIDDLKSVVDMSTLWVPVPSHKKRYKERGYDVLDVLFDRCIPMKQINKQLVYRTKNTPYLYTLNHQKRKAALKNAFEIDNANAGQIENKNVVIYDDILTTGASVEAVAKKILIYKPKTINAVIFSVTPKNENC
ncbi:MAG: hypothetical protein VW378_01565 [bacterium]